MKLQRLYSLTRQALDQYDMIESGDRIAVGISGGKDSLTLLYAMSGLQRFYPKSFTLTGITVDLGYNGTSFTEIDKLCQTLGIEYHVVNTDIGEMLPEQKPCSLCARLRKGALNQKALELGCNKIAYAHHMDDVIETLMMSLIYEGRLSCFWPVTAMEDTGLTVIRPMLFVPEADIIGFKNRYQLPVVASGCPYEEETERAYVKELIRQLNLHTPGVKKRLMTAVIHGNLEGW
ncbi:MAG: tRNA 2-thiocytidine(32) synthetase TtcA [Lachnospiraceae bacterium]|nr:tRNA 2-thiocytidine(32) synthetase TtcA [Lachnospiraceae bacterium]